MGKKRISIIWPVLIVFAAFIVLVIIVVPRDKEPEKPQLSLPSYEVLDVVDLIDGSGKYGDILIESFSTDTPKDIRGDTLRAIAKKEG